MTAWRFLFLSIAVHLLIWLIMLNRPSFKFPKDEKSVEVTLVEKSSKTPKQITRQALVPLDMLKPEPPKDPKYLSEKDQNVKKEMKAQQSGITQNGNSNINQKQVLNPPQKASGRPVDGEGLEKFAPGPITNLPPAQAPQVMTSNGEYLPDMANGPITALNSERFIYYSFFSRIEDRLRPIWERNVENTIQRLPASVQKSLPNHNWITSLEVLIDGEGHYLDSIVLQSSGIRELDNAAIAAFAEGKFYPNPPKEMIKSDKRIHLSYAFVVQWGSAGWGRR